MEQEKTTETISQTQIVGENKQTFSIQAAIIVAGLMISVSILASGFLHGKLSTAGAGDEPAVAVNIKDVSVDGEPFIGNVNAPALAYFSDYQCPFCKKFDSEILPAIAKTYVETGKLKVVFKDFTFLGPDSTTAAGYARAVWKLYPAQYFAWRESMYNAQDEEGGQGFGDLASIEKLTKSIPGIDQEKVSADYTKNQLAYEALVDADYEEAKKFGVEGTPTIIVGKTIIAGYYPLATYTEDIKKAFD